MAARETTSRHRTPNLSSFPATGLPRRVLAVGPAEKLDVNPDCGFGWSPRYMCNQKVGALAAGAALVRAELTGKR